MTSAYCVHSFHIMDVNEGTAILQKYYSCSLLFESGAKQSAFEKSIHAKIKSSGSINTLDVLLLEKNVVVYKIINDVMFVLVSGLEDNELLIGSALDCFTDTLTDITRQE